MGYTVKLAKVFHDKIDAASLTTGYVVADGEVSETMLGVGETYRKDFSRGPSVHRFKYPYFIRRRKIVLVETSCPSVIVSSSVVTFDQLSPPLVFSLILKCKEVSLQIITNSTDFRNTVIVISSN